MNAKKEAPKLRPQMLVLTGDQIYADDVADSLLHMILDASKTLIGWDEVLSGTGPVSKIYPGRRTSVVRELGFTSGIGQDPDLPRSHLLSLSEYIVMYLLVWSDVLWDVHLPSFDDVFFDKELHLYRVPKYEEGRVIVGHRGQDWYAPDGETKTHECRKFEETQAILRQFKDDLVAVRRALANVPTYMIFDDHEVTDDWYITSDWCNRVLSNSAGRQVIANGLAAYALCQAWGNEPAAFCLDQPGGRLRSKVNSGQCETNAAALEEHLLPPLESVFDTECRLNPPKDLIDWHYRLTFDAFELVAADTRTQRQFPPDITGFPILIHDRALSKQIRGSQKDGSFSRDLVILAFAPPLVGIPGIEGGQMTRPPQHVTQPPGIRRLEFDCEAPGLQPYFYERLIARLAQAAPNKGDNRKANIAIFSGDVHYAFSARLRYTARKPFLEQDPAELVLHQLTASAVKNQPAPWYRGWALHSLGIAEGHVPLPDDRFLPTFAFGLPPVKLVLGFRDYKSLSSSERLSIRTWCMVTDLYSRSPFRPVRCETALQHYASGAYAARVELYDFGSRNEDLVSWDWKYRIEFLKDRRVYLERYLTEEGRECVGYNNLGVVSFTTSYLQFDLWYSVLGKSAVPATRTESSLSFED